MQKTGKDIKQAGKANSKISTPTQSEHELLNHLQYVTIAFLGFDRLF